jgi:iron complex transport system substrate-binding protein
MRIVSLLPAATEMICALGLEPALVGVTHECDYPASVRALPKVTRTLIPEDAASAEIDRLVRERLAADRALYTLDLPVLEALRPDLIVTQALCDVCAVAEAEVRAAACALPGAPRVLNLEPQTLSQVFEAMRAVGRAAGIEARADSVVAELVARVEAVALRSMRVRRRPRVALLEWLDPPFSSGHWNPTLVRMAGGTELLGAEGRPSRTLTWREVVEARPEVVFIACCGFTVERAMRDVPALATVPGWADLPAVRAGRVHLADGGQYFNRPGPRLVDSLEMLAHALHPEVHTARAGGPAAMRLVRDPSTGSFELSRDARVLPEVLL